MKRCINANCQSAFVYGDDKTVCPFCHGRLADVQNNQNNRNTNQRRITPADRITTPVAPNRPNVQFVQNMFGGMQCHGRVVEVDRQELFLGTWQKIFNAIFRGEPYQFGHQSVEYTIRVESLGDTVPPEVTDFCLYGNYLGRIHVGDELVIKAKNHRHRRVATKIYNRTTNSPVKPGIQIPGWLVGSSVLSVIAMILMLVMGLVTAVASGALVAAVVSVICSLMPIIIVFGGIYMLIRSILPGRRR